MKNYDFEACEIEPKELEEHLQDKGYKGWDYCQTLVNQRMKKNLLTNQGTIEISYLVIMKREVE